MKSWADSVVLSGLRKIAFLATLELERFKDTQSYILIAWFLETLDCEKPNIARERLRSHTCATNSVEKKVFKDLTRKILESCMSEDDLIYFSGMDDSSIMDKNYFDI